MIKNNILKTPILIIGLGSIGKRHLRNLYNIGHRNINVLRISNKNLLELNYKKMIKSIFFNDQDAFNVGPKYIIICLPTSMHRKYIIKGININAQIFCEIPLFHNYLRNDLKFLKKFNFKNKIFITGFNFRFHPIIIKIKKIIEENKIGTPMFSKLHFGEKIDNIHTWEDFKSRYEVRKELGGGVTRTSAHEIDMVYFLFGKIRTLYCEQKNLKIKDINCEDFVHINFTHSNGVNSTIILDFISDTYTRKMEIFFTKGIIEWNFKNSCFNIYKNNKWKRNKYKFDFNLTYINALKCFLGLNKNKDYSDLNDGMYIQKIISKLDYSSKKGKKINLR